MMDETEKYIASVYWYDDPSTFVRRTDLPTDLRAKVEMGLSRLPPHMWSSLASPADHFFMRDNYALPMHCYLEFVERV